MIVVHVLVSDHDLVSGNNHLTSNCLDSKGSLFQTVFIVTAAGVQSMYGGPLSLPERHHSANYTFLCFGIKEFILGHSKYRVTLKDLLGGMNSVPLTIAAHE